MEIKAQFRLVETGLEHSLTHPAEARLEPMHHGRYRRPSPGAPEAA